MVKGSEKPATISPNSCEQMYVATASAAYAACLVAM